MPETATPIIPQTVRIYVAKVGDPDRPVYGCMPFILRSCDFVRTEEVMWRGDFYPGNDYSSARLAAERECHQRYWMIINPENIHAND